MVRWHLTWVTLMTVVAGWLCLVGAAAGGGVLDDPVAFGAWLYRMECARCHFDYADDRMGGEYDSERSLAEAIGEGRCRISWSRREGGIFGRKELRALATYMMTWEERGEEPDLPELPPTFEETEAEPKKVAAAVKQAAQPSQEGGTQLHPALRRVVETNTVAQGGWLYTRHCYRCHLTYGKARMGKGMPAENVQRFITEGKTSTQMKPFSAMLGGELKTSEIKAVVSYISTWEEAGEELAIAAGLMTPPALDPAEFEPTRLTRFRPVGGDTAAGSRLYRLHCSGCHGDSGEGYVGPALPRSIWVVRPDLYIKSVVKQGVPGGLMRSWDSGRGGALSAKDIDDVVGFVLGKLSGGRADNGAVDKAATNGMETL